MQTTEQRSYYAIIPANVRYDKKLPANAKLLYGEITALCNEKGYCWAGNSYFSDLYNVDVSTIKRWLKALEDNGYINRKVSYKAKSKEIESRYIRLGVAQKRDDPRCKNEPDNNTVNNTYNNTNNIYTSNQDSSEERFKEIWKLYPKKTMRKEALAVYKRVIKKGTTDQEIIAGINNYLKDLENNTWKKAMDGGRWFQKERWNDEFDTTKGRSGNHDTSEYDDLF